MKLKKKMKKKHETEPKIIENHSTKKCLEMLEPYILYGFYEFCIEGKYTA